VSASQTIPLGVQSSFKPIHNRERHSSNRWAGVVKPPPASVAHNDRRGRRGGSKPFSVRARTPPTGYWERRWQPPVLVTRNIQQQQTPSRQPRRARLGDCDVLSPNLPIRDYGRVARHPPTIAGAIISLDRKFDESMPSTRSVRSSRLVGSDLRTWRITTFRKPFRIRSRLR
jgi:hypothetical protein